MASLTDIVGRQWQQWGPIFRAAKLKRYEYLSEAIADHDTAPALIDYYAAVRVLVALHTGLQPSEYGKLAPFERLPFLERTAALLGIRDEDDDSEEDATGTKLGDEFDTGARIYLPKAIADELGCSQKTINRKAKAAGVQTPRRGQRDFRYTAAGRAAILEQFIADGTDLEQVETAKTLLQYGQDTDSGTNNGQ